MADGGGRRRRVRGGGVLVGTARPGHRGGGARRRGGGPAGPVRRCGAGAGRGVRGPGTAGCGAARTALRRDRCRAARPPRSGRPGHRPGPPGACGRPAGARRPRARRDRRGPAGLGRAAQCPAPAVPGGARTRGGRLPQGRALRTACRPPPDPAVPRSPPSSMRRSTTTLRAATRPAATGRARSRTPPAGPRGAVGLARRTGATGHRRTWFEWSSRECIIQPIALRRPFRPAPVSAHLGPLGVPGAEERIAVVLRF